MPVGTDVLDGPLNLTNGFYLCSHPTHTIKTKPVGSGAVRRVSTLEKWFSTNKIGESITLLKSSFGPFLERKGQKKPKQVLPTPACQTKQELGGRHFARLHV